MEYRAVVVLYRGENVPKNVLERFVNDLRAFADADVEAIDAYTLDSKDICKSIVNKVMSPVKNDELVKAMAYVNENYFENSRKPYERIYLDMYCDYMCKTFPNFNQAVDIIFNNQTAARSMCEIDQKPIPGKKIVEIIMKIKKFATDV